MTPNDAAGKIASLVVRRGQQEIQLGLGDCFIGRDPDCGMCFDDPLISRKHAKISVGTGAATITDLASANGVFVNGRRVVAVTPLKTGDHILIGKEEMEITSLGKPSRPPQGNGLVSHDTLRLQPPKVVEANVDPGPDVTSRVDTFALISKVVDRVLAEGRGADAEKMLSPQLDVLLREVTRRGGLPSEASNRATEYAVKLAEATRRGKWVDYVIQLHMAALRPLPSGVTRALISAAKGCPDFDRNAVRSYVSRLLSTAERLTPAERSDLEALGGLAGAGPGR